MSGDEPWPPSAESFLPLLGLSEAAVVVADVAAALCPGRAPEEARVLVARTAWLIADRRLGVLVRSADRVIQVAVAREDGRFAPFARVHWADLPREWRPSRPSSSRSAGRRSDCTRSRAAFPRL